MTRPQEVQHSRVQTQLQGQNHSAFSIPGGVVPGNQLITYRHNPYSLHGFYLELAIGTNESGKGLKVLWDAPPTITPLPAQEGIESLIKEYKEQYKIIRKLGNKDYEYLGKYMRRRPIDYLINEQNLRDQQYPRIQYEFVALKVHQKPINLANTKQMDVGMTVILKRQIKDERNQMYLMAAEQQRWPQGPQSQPYPSVSPHAPSQMPHPGQPQPIPQGHPLPGPPPQGPPGPPMNSGGPGGAPPNPARPVNQPPPPPPAPGGQQRSSNAQKGPGEPQKSKGAKEARSNSSKRREQDIRIIQSRDRDDVSSSNEDDGLRHHDDNESDDDDRGRHGRYQGCKPGRNSSRSRGRKSQEYSRTRPKSPARRSSMSNGPTGYAEGLPPPLKALTRRGSIGQDHRRSPRTSASYLPRDSLDRLPRAPEVPKGQVVNITIQANDRQSREIRRHAESTMGVDEPPRSSYGYSSSGSELDYEDAGGSTFSGHGGSDFTTSSPSSSGSLHDAHYYGGRRGSLHKPTKDRLQIHRAFREHSKPPSYVMPLPRDNQLAHKYLDDVDVIPGVSYMSKRRNSTHQPIPRRSEYYRSFRSDYGPELARNGHVLHAGPPYSSREHPDESDWHDDYFPEAIFDHEQPIRRPIRRRQIVQRLRSYNDHMDERGGWE